MVPSPKGLVVLYGFSDRICEAVSHYVDGLFIASICNLLAVMMVYKVCYPRPPLFISLHPLLYLALYRD